MKIGITGANGFIGNHLLRSAVERGHRPVAFLQNGTSLVPIQDLDGRYEACWGDLMDPAALDRFFRQCDAVIHLAGFNRYWAKDASVFGRINHEGARRVAEAAFRNGTEKLVHVSSCITLGASDAPVARNEDSEFNLESLRFRYAETKKAGEDEILSWVHEKGLPAVIVHPASAIGERDHGPTPIGRSIADIRSGRWPVYVPGGACFIDVRDVVRGLWLALEHGRMGERYLLAGDNLSNREFMSRVADCAGVARPRVKLPRPLLHALAWAGEWSSEKLTGKEPALTAGMAGLVGKYLFFDGRKAEYELGFKAGPCTPAIQRCIDWFEQEARAHGPHHGSDGIHRTPPGDTPDPGRQEGAGARPSGERGQAGAGDPPPLRTGTG